MPPLHAVGKGGEVVMASGLGMGALLVGISEALSQDQAEHGLIVLHEVASAAHHLLLHA